ncbi:MAG TPA: type III-B CRISPR module RAMP protein Cmr4 [Pseudonocardiaceae bacterium]|nr:type III-B CRISPR module RAMP protein Cmr4 [Pseudonocardiaceae bacterium]
MERRLLTLLAETPVHAGGPESLAAVDLPIQREAATGLPVIWGQSLKGALRQAWRDAGLDDEVAAFGSRPPRRVDSAEDDLAGAADGDVGGALTKGAISVGDAQLLLFPAATLREVFAWVTTPLLLSRLGRKLRLLGADPGAAFTVGLTDGYGLGTPGWQGTQVIGPFFQNIRADAQAGTIGAALARLVCPDDPAFGFTRQKMSDDLLLVEDSTMTGLAQMGTDVVARVQLEEESKTVAHGPFYSEHLPAETVLATLLAGADEHLDRLAELLDGRPIQLGGDETIGKGVLWCRLHSATSSAAAIGPAVAVAPAPVVESAAAVEAAVPAAPVPLPTPLNRPSPATIAGRKRG